MEDYAQWNPTDLADMHSDLLKLIRYEESVSRKEKLQAAADLLKLAAYEGMAHDH